MSIEVFLINNFWHVLALSKSEQLKQRRDSYLECKVNDKVNDSTRLIIKSTSVIFSKNMQD